VDMVAGSGDGETGKGLLFVEEVWGFCFD